MNRKIKSGFTTEQHVQFGAALLEMDDSLHKTIILASHVYAVNGREIRAMERAHRAIELLRAVMDTATEKEPHAFLEKIYYAYYPKPTR